VLVARRGAEGGFPGKGRGTPGVLPRALPILFSISDDGVGLRSRPGPQSRPGPGSEGGHDDEGFGMRTMRQRAAILGAHIDFISVEDSGLMVCVKVPLPPC
jgi:two-component system NarL family sensor kinase